MLLYLDYSGLVNNIPDPVLNLSLRNSAILTRADKDVFVLEQLYRHYLPLMSPSPKHLSDFLNILGVDTVVQL